MWGDFFFLEAVHKVLGGSGCQTDARVNAGDRTGVLRTPARFGVVRSERGISGLYLAVAAQRATLWLALESARPSERKLAKTARSLSMSSDRPREENEPGEESERLRRLSGVASADLRTRNR